MKYEHFYDTYNILKMKVSLQNPTKLLTISESLLHIYFCILNDRMTNL